MQTIKNRLDESYFRILRTLALIQFYCARTLDDADVECDG